MRCLMFVVIALSVVGCSSVRTTSPARSAQELLLISTAADRAAEALAAQVPPDLTAFIDPSGFAAQDQAYGLAAIQEALLRRGVRIVGDKSQAQAIIAPRSGALSTYERHTIMGIPSLPATTPFAGGVVLPALSLYEKTVEKGVAKFAASIYDPKTGKLIVSTAPAYGFSRQSDGILLFLYTWSRNDIGVDLRKNPPAVKIPTGT